MISMHVLYIYGVTNTINIYNATVDVLNLKMKKKKKTKKIITFLVGKNNFSFLQIFSSIANIVVSRWNIKCSLTLLYCGNFKNIKKNKTVDF